MMDGLEHFIDTRSRISDTLKEQYCNKFKLKLYRFDNTATFDDYLKIFDDPIDDKYIYKIGKNY